MAMRRSIADLVTNFRVNGLDRVRGQFDRMTQTVRKALDRVNNSKVGQGLKKGFDAAAKAGQAIKTKMDQVAKGVREVTKRVNEQAKAFAKAAAESAKVGAGKAKGVGLAGAAIGMATGIGGMAMARKASSEISGQVLETERLGRSLGISVEHMSQLAILGREAGVQLDGMAGMMMQFQEAARAAASGEWEGTQFKGIELLAPVDQLEQFSKKWARLRTQAQRDNFLADIFGRENIAAASELMDKISRQGNLRNTLNRSDIGFSKEDLKRSQDYRKSVNALTETWRRFQTLLARHFTPIFANIAKIGARLLEHFGPAIVRSMAEGWRRFVTLAFELFVILTGINKIGPITLIDMKNHRVQNAWIFKLRDGIGEVWKAAKLVGAGLMTVVRWIGQAAPAVQRFGQRAASIVRDLYAMMTGGTASEQNKFLVDWKIEIIGAIAYVRSHIEFLRENWRLLLALMVVTVKQAVAPIIAYFGGMWESITSGIAYAKEAMADFIAGLTTGNIDARTTIFGKIAAGAHEAVSWIIRLGQAIVDIAQGLNASPEFAWLQGIVDSVGAVIESVQNAHAAFMALLEPINQVLQLFGTDITTALFFIGFLKFSGILGGILGLFKKFGPAAKALIGNFGTIATAIGASGGIQAALSGLGTKILAFAGVAGPWAVFGAAAVAAGALIANALDGTIVDKWFQNITDKLHDVEGAFERTRNQIDSDFERYGGRKPGLGAAPLANRSASAINRAAAPMPVGGYAPGYEPGGQYSWTDPGRQATDGKTTNLNINVGGQTINATAPADQVAALQQSRARSMTGGRG